VSACELQKKTIVIPIFDCLVFDTMDVPPSADQVAAAIIAACRETGADPESVASGAKGAGSRFPISRARAYAALAIRAVFPENGSVALGRMVGSNAPSSYVTQIDNQLRNGLLKWWDDKTFMRVVEALEAHIKASESHAA
jgi:hypothetical protein